MPKKILLADDSMTIQKVIKLTFADEDFDVSIADNGEDAVNKAREMKPDIVLADVAIPGKNGYEICEAVKNAPETSGVPVLLLAGTFEPLDAGEAERVKADGHIVKPFESKELMDKVRGLVERFPVSEAEEPGEEAPPTAPETGAPETGPDESIWGEGDFIKAPDAEAGPAPEETPELPDLEVFEGRAFLSGEAGEEKVTSTPVVERGEGEEEVDVISAEAPEMETAPGEAEGEAAFDVEGFEENPFAGGTVEKEPFGGAEPDTANEREGGFTGPAGEEPLKEETGWAEEPRAEEDREGEAFFGEGEAATEEPEATGEKAEEEEEVEKRAAAEGGVTLSDEKVEEIVDKVAREVVGEIARDLVPGLAREMVAEEIEKLREVLTKLKP
ncbi:MAG: PleD family two-component system response regulator [Thermodesulfobacteriota bacterium]